MNKLYNKLIKNISESIKLSLNEMAKKIDHRTIDRKLWLSVSSVCSRNKSTEAEFVKPMKKLTKDDLLNRYVAGLLIMKKPCPKNEKEIESLKTLKLFALKAIELGATILDIQNLYNINAGISTNVKQLETNKSNLFNNDIFNDAENVETLDELDINTHIGNKTLNSVLPAIKKALDSNDDDAFVKAMNEYTDLFTELNYSEKTANWKLVISNGQYRCLGYDRANPYLNSTGLHMNGNKYSTFDNSPSVILDGENFMSCLCKKRYWREGYGSGYWDKYETRAEWNLVLTNIPYIDSNTIKGACNSTAKDDLYELLTKWTEKFDSIIIKNNEIKSQYNPHIYGFDKEPSSYVNWVKQYAPVFMKNNNIKGSTFYDGIYLDDCDTSFWTGSIKALTPDGLLYWVGGDSTDEEGKIAYYEWTSSREFHEYANIAEVHVRLSYDEREKISENIYNYLKNRAEKGLIK